MLEILLIRTIFPSIIAFIITISMGYAIFMKFNTTFNILYEIMKNKVFILLITVIILLSFPYFLKIFFREEYAIALATYISELTLSIVFLATFFVCMIIFRRTTRQSINQKTIMIQKMPSHIIEDQLNHNDEFIEEISISVGESIDFTLINQNDI